MKSRKFMAIAMAAISIGTMAAFASCGGNDNSGSSGSGTSDSGTSSKSLNITGSSSVAPLMSALADSYEKKNSGVRITVTTSDSGTGIKDAQKGLNDFGMASRKLKDAEKGVVSKQIATDGIALIVNKASAVTNVTSEEVYELYANGTAIQSAITAGITRESGSGTRDAFGELIKNSEGNTLKSLTTLASVITQQGSTDAVKTAIVGNVNQMGYISLGSMDNTVKALQFKGVDATVANVKNGTYELSRPFNIVYQSEDKLSAVAKAFIEYIMSADGQKIVEAKGYITVA